MKSVEEVINIIKDSNYFEAWKDSLLSETTVQEWKLLLKHDLTTKNFYEKIAQRLYMKRVPYVIVNEYIDEFFRHHKNHSIDHHNIKNFIAEAFLKEQLKSDRELIEIELNKKISVTLEEKKDLINAHLKWMQLFIQSIIDKPQKFELDHHLCYVGKWLAGEAENKDTKIDELHSNLHAMAQSAIRMYNRQDYAYFLLLYLDILMSSYQIRDLIMNLYFTRRLSSIHKDFISNKSNYLKLKEDIKQAGENTTLLILNIKDFSKINLLYGHDYGDKILKEIANILEGITNILEVYRIYGDEFAVSFYTPFTDEIIKIIKKESEKKKFTIYDNSFSLSYYASYSRISQHVLEHCEYGLMLSKKEHGHVINVNDINDAMFYKYAENITLTQKLRLAFMDNRIIPYFQPIFNFKENKITKYEALMRVVDIDGKILVPAEFLDVLKSMYIYPEVTKLMIEKVFEFFKDSELDFSINLSFTDIIDLEIEGFIIAIVKKYPEVATRCTFELLEDEVSFKQKEAYDFFDLLHAYGVKIALDDFGSGYSNYDVIFKFDIDYIKIDGSITESILFNSKSKVLMESIITVTKKLDSQLIAEYVSSKEIFDAVSKMGIDYAQGYYIGKPSDRLLQ